MPSDSTDRTIKTLLAVGSVLVLAYSLVIAQQILLGVLAAVVLWGIYLVWRLISVLERIAGSLEYRIAQSEREPDERTARESEFDGGREREREPEHER
ncbi:hypothetical protein [Haloarcula montana]|uniref:hypothetical protein n=1 Tax=Haloarcula montana TaxID=3111776 RepID=UPI002D78C672|nr:hypothetical protein [Haloarcula sp. GH36]